MKLLLLIIFLPICSFGQCDSLKIKAATWVLQRNNALEQVRQLEQMDSISREQIVALRASDSLNRVALQYSDSVIAGQGALIRQYSSDAERWERRARRARRLVIIAGIGGFVGGVIIGK